MGRAEAGTPKAVSNAMKARGLTRLRWYCQVCAKACRDANGYKLHIESESHMRQLAAVAGDEGQRAGKMIHDFSAQFQREFVSLLSRRFGTRRVLANQVYQEYIRERHHLHMNATRWVSLSEFVKHLGRSGIARIEASELGWFIEWIDTSTSALARQDAIRKMERSKIDDEQRERKELDQQIRRAGALESRESVAQAQQTEERRAAGLQRNAPVRLALRATEGGGVGDGGQEQSAEPAAGTAAAVGGAAAAGDAAEASTSTSTPAAPPPVAPPAAAPVPPAPARFTLKPAAAPPAAAPAPAAPRAPRANPLKSAAPPARAKRPPPAHLSAAERIIMEEDAAREQRAAAPKRMHGPVRDAAAKRSRF